MGYWYTIAAAHCFLNITYQKL